MTERRFIPLSEVVEKYLKSKEIKIMEKQSWFRRNLKDLILLVVVVGAVIVAVMGWHWEETAEKKAWWTFWPIASVACILGLFVGWIILWQNDSKKRK